MGLRGHSGQKMLFLSKNWHNLTLAMSILLISILKLNIQLGPKAFFLPSEDHNFLSKISVEDVVVINQRKWQKYKANLN